MTHEEYLSGVAGFTDSNEDVEAVLLHASSCAACRKERRSVERELSRLDPNRKSIGEEVARFAATAAIVAMVVLGMREISIRTREAEATQPAPRYRIVGNASGVVAYTPSGIVVGMNSAEKGVTR
jgi:hypothetical protein